MSFEIRLATQKDSPAVVKIIKEVYDEYHFTWDPDDYHADLYDLDTHYIQAGQLFWIAEQGNIPLATCALEFFQNVPGHPGEVLEHNGERRIGASDCALQRLYVRPSVRLGGVGTALFLNAMDEARSRGRKQMEIWSDKRFEAAHRLYQKHGASVVGDRICDDPDVSPEWGLALPL